MFEASRNNEPATTFLKLWDKEANRLYLWGYMFSQIFTRVLSYNATL